MDKNTPSYNDNGLFEINPIPTLICDGITLQIYDCNQAAIEYFQYTKEDFVKYTLKDLFYTEDNSEVFVLDNTISSKKTNINFGIFIHKKKNGELVKTKINGYIMDNDEKKYVMIVCQEQIDNHQKQNSLQETKILLDTSLDVICSIDENGKFIRVSAASIQHWGYSPEELEGRAYIELVHPEDIKKTNQAAAQIISGKNLTTFENRYIKKNGEIAFNLWSAHWDETIKVMYTVARDATQKREIEQLLIESESRFKSLVQEGLDLIGILDAEGNYSYVSPTSKTVLGIGPEEFLGKSPFEFIHPEDAKKVTESLASIATEYRVEVIPFRFQNSIGQWRWIKTILTNMLDHPSIKGIVANSRDITEQVEEQNRLKLLESVILNTNDAVLITEAEPFDEPGPRIIYVNEAFTKMTGYTSEEVIGKSPRLLQGPKSDKNGLLKLGKALRKWEPCEVTTINYKKNGEEFWINFTVTPVANEKGWYTHLVAIERDVTEKKIQELEQILLNKISQIFNEEKKLKKASQRLCETFADYGEFDFVEVWIPNLENTSIKMLSCSNQSCAGTEFYRDTVSLKELSFGEGLIGSVWKSKKAVVLELSDDNAIFVRREAAKKAGIKSVIGIPLLFKDTLVGVLVFGSSKKVDQLSHYLNIFKQLESYIGSEINRKSLETNLNQMFQSIPDIICITDFQSRFLKINKAGCDLLGYSEEEILYHSFEEFVHPQDKEIFIDELLKLENRETIFKFENRFLTKKREIIWLSWTCNSESNEGHIYASAKNITREKKLSELHIQTSSLAKIGSWEIDLIENKLLWTDQVYELHEIDPNTLTPNVDTAINFYREDFREMVSESVQLCATKGAPFSFEAVIVTIKNNERWVKVNGQSELVDGNCIRIYGSFQDIHDRKEANQKILDAFEEKNNILESIGDAFFALDKDWKVTYWNKEAEKILFRKRHEVVGKNLWEVYVDAIDSEFYKQYHLAVETGEKVSFEAFYPTISRWFEVSAYPNMDGLSVYFKDITLRKEADIELLKANERFEKATEATNDAIWDWDIENGVFFRGQGIENFFGKKTLKLLNNETFWKDSFYPEDLPHIMQSLDEAIKNPLILRWDMEYRIFKEDGEIGYVVDKGIIIRNKDGKAIRMVGAMTDVSERKKHETESLKLNESLKRYTLELEATNEQLEQFAFIASHDLQEPLRMVYSFLDQLKRKYENQLDDKAKQYIHFATDGAKRMKQIILDLLEYSRAGKTNENLEEIDLNDILLDYRLLRSKIISEKNATIHSGELPVFLAYKVPLIQTMHCLIDNAIKYSKNDSSPVIKIMSEEKDEKWIISIKDNGIGISKEYFEKIFVIFQRLHNKNEYDGTGIGLALSKKNVEAWGGKIWIESIVNQGTTIYFSIPKQSN